MKVVCETIRTAFPEQIEIGQVYYLDATNMFGDSEGWFAPTYDANGNFIGVLNVLHFKRIE